MLNGELAAQGAFIWGLKRTARETKAEQQQSLPIHAPLPQHLQNSLYTGLIGARPSRTRNLKIPPSPRRRGVDYASPRPDLIFRASRVLRAGLGSLGLLVFSAALGTLLDLCVILAQGHAGLGCGIGVLDGVEGLADRSFAAWRSRAVTTFRNQGPEG